MKLIKIKKWFNVYNANNELLFMSINQLEALNYISQRVK